MNRFKRKDLQNVIDYIDEVVRELSAASDYFSEEDDTRTAIKDIISRCNEIVENISNVIYRK